MNMGKNIARAPLAFLVLSTMWMLPAAARDNVVSLTISTAMTEPDVQEKVDNSVQYYFGETPHPAVRHSFGYFVSNQKTSSFMRSDLKACTRAFADAMIEFQKRAHELGANAVIKIYSYYKREDISNDTSVPCHAGGVVAGLALRGEFVQLAGH